MKIAFTTLGCKLNYAETATYQRGFEAAGWEVVRWTEPADIYLVNTCAVTETAEKKSRNLIRRAHKTAPEARIVVTGCYAQLRREQLLSIDGVWRVFGANEKSQIVPTIVAEGTNPEIASASLRPLPFSALRASLGPSLLSGRGWPEVSACPPASASALSKVVLPQPLGPARRRHSPGAMEKAASRTEP